jgi:hypothetical protein
LVLFQKYFKKKKKFGKNSKIWKFSRAPQARGGVTPNRDLLQQLYTPNETLVTGHFRGA